MSSWHHWHAAPGISGRIATWTSPTLPSSATGTETPTWMPGTRCCWMTALVTCRAVFVSAARKIQSTWVRAASARGSATSQARSGGNLLPAVQCRHVGGGQTGIPSLLVRHPSRAVVDEAVTEHLVDGIVNGL